MRAGEAPVGRRAAQVGCEDEGFALITVVGTMAVLMLFVLAATAFAAGNVPNSRRAQDYAAAIAAAQAGVDDFLSRLNTCDTHWAAPCPGSAAETARDAWATVPGSPQPLPAQYTYTVVSTPATTPGLIRLRASGRVNGVERTITADLRKDGFLQFIYYTDKESFAPALYQRLYASSYPAYSRTVNYSISGGTAFREDYSGLTAAGADACGRHYYSVPPASGARGLPTQTKTVRWRISGVEQTPIVSTVTLTTSGGTNASSCDINFVGGDVINGPMYTKDAMLIMTSGGVGPRFNGTTETFWQQSYSPAANPAAPYRVNSGTPGATPHPAGFTPTIATRILDLPPTNTAIRAQADHTSGGQGCMYQGPTRILLNSNGTMDVTSPTTTSTKPGCGPGTGLSLPSNGVIYVDRMTSACPGNGKSLQTYPINNDVTTYDCRAGDVFIQGTLKGQLTVAGAGDIIVTDDLKYSQTVWNGTSIDTSVTDVLGLVAQGWVFTYHPVTSAGGELAGSQVSNLQIDAAILSVDNSFTVQNFNRGSGLGTLKIRGGIYQRYRGPVGTSGGNTGYLKDYVYDTRLVSLPPPHFLEPTSAPWRVTGLSE